MFSILIHADLYRSLKDAKRDLLGRVRKTLLRLRDGHWGGGTCVKRLRGINRAVFEARLDRSDRILFTAIRSADPHHPDRLGTYLQVWDIVSHDNVSKAARRNRAAEAEFLAFDVEEQFDIEEPPPVPEAPLDSIPSGTGADLLLHFLIPPDNFEPKPEEGIAGAVRWFQTSAAMLAGDDEFQRIIDSGTAGLELKLTREQYNVLLAPGPALVAGSAGSGKTTIAIHRLADVTAVDVTPPLRALYISYSPWLVDHAKGLYRDLVTARGTASNAVGNEPRFTTFNDLYLSLLPAAERGQFSDPVTVARFRAWFTRSGIRMDAALVWEEIRSILKGACLNLGKTMLDEAEYLDLGRKRAPLFVDERPEIYRIAQRYQQWLGGKQADPIDLCRRAALELRHGKFRRFDAVICDEAQDLTEIEIAFVLALSADPAFKGVMLSGDTQQIVNPSGFRWSEVRQSIMKLNRGSLKAPPLLRLRRNFRSVRPVVELANCVLALRRDIYGRSDEDDPEEAVLEGPAPIQVVDSEARALEAIRNFGPRCAVLAFNEAERESLQRRLETTRIFHVQEAKGLEFDTIVLWRILGAEADLIERFFRHGLHMEKDARFRQFLQHLYVALTRARRHVAIFEGPEAHAFWNEGRFANRLDLESAEALSRLFRESATPKEWRKEGDYYFERQRYRQAAECYRRAGQSNKEVEAAAMFAESVEDWTGALARWTQIGALDRQAPMLEKLGRLNDAVALYRKLGRTAEADVVEIRLIESHGRWAEAGQRWEALGYGDDAIRCYRKSGDRARAVGFEAAQAEAGKQWALAGARWMEIRSWEAAARCFRKAKDAKNAALCGARHAESLLDWTRAATAYKRAGETRKADECRARALESAGKLTQAAKILERLNETSEALRLYRKAGDDVAVERLEFARIDMTEDQAARVVALEKSGQFALADRIATARMRVLRAELRKRLPQPKRYGINGQLQFMNQIRNRCRARLAESKADWINAEKFWRKLGDYNRANDALRKAAPGIADPALRGRAWANLREWQLAIDTFTEAGMTASAKSVTAYMFEASGRYADAAAMWNELGRKGDESRCRYRAGLPAGTPRMTSTAGMSQPGLFEDDPF